MSPGQCSHTRAMPDLGHHLTGAASEACRETAPSKIGCKGQRRVWSSGLDRHNLLSSSLVSGIEQLLKSHPPTGVKEDRQAETCLPVGFKSCSWHLKAIGTPWVIQMRGAMWKCLKAQAKGMNAAELQAASKEKALVWRDKGWEEIYQAW